VSWDLQAIDASGFRAKQNPVRESVDVTSKKRITFLYFNLKYGGDDIAWAVLIAQLSDYSKERALKEA
jgi:hypothetical protein